MSEEKNRVVGEVKAPVMLTDLDKSTRSHMQEVKPLLERIRQLEHENAFILERTKDSATLERCSFLNKHIAKLEDALMETAAIAFSEGLLSDSVYELIRNNPKLPMHMRELKNQ